MSAEGAVLGLGLAVEQRAGRVAARAHALLRTPTDRPTEPTSPPPRLAVSPPPPRRPYQRGGIVTQHKSSKTLAFKPLARALQEPGEFLLSDFSQVCVCACAVKA